MAFKKPEPGLDEVMSDEALDEWVNGAPPAVMEEPPSVRVWLSVSIAAAFCIPISLITGILVADYVTVLQVLFVVCSIVTASAAVALLDRRAQGTEGP